MTKLFCDNCGEEISDHSGLKALSSQESIRGEKVAVFVVLKVEGVISDAPAVDLCKYCALKILNSKDDRPRAAG